MEFGEKKVEYIELIYDLVFVFFIGRNNELLHHFEGGFFSLETYLGFFFGTLVILQVWYLSTLFINRYGDNSIRNTIGLFINMYLIYFMAGATRPDWENYYLRYHIAWALILVNLAIQYFLHLRQAKEKSPWEVPHIKRHILMLLIQTAIIFASIPVYQSFGLPLSWVSLAAGFIFVLMTRNADFLIPVNFEHLTERVMLFVVFTFGEMIISIAVYFEEPFSLRVFFFSLMAFLIAAGLFLSYGFLYNHVIDRNLTTTGTTYMLLHVALLVALCNITAALGFMKEPEVAAVPKNILLVVSFLVYYLFLLLIGTFSKDTERLSKKTLVCVILVAAAYVAVMFFAYENSYISIAASVLFIFAEHIMLALNHRKAQVTVNENPA